MTFTADWRPTSQNQVIGESEADGAFVRAVALAHGVPEFDFTAPTAPDGRALGKHAFKTHLNGMQHFIQRGLVSRVVVVGDNDADHGRAVADIRRAIREAKDFPTPSVRPLDIATNGKVSISFVMLPGTGENGCLETLLLKATMRGGPSNQCLDDWAACAAFPTGSANNFHKFRLRSLLAAAIHDEPNISLRRIWAKSNNPIDPLDPEFTWIAEFLKKAFA